MKEFGDLIPQQWVSPCGNHCTSKYAAIKQIPWRVFCKKGCGADGDTWDECVTTCEQICYKDPVLKDQQWSAYIDRSPGVESYSEECFHACVSGCGYKFEMPAKLIEECHPNRPAKTHAIAKSAPKKPTAPLPPPKDDMPTTSA